MSRSDSGGRARIGGRWVVLGCLLVVLVAGCTVPTATPAESGAEPRGDLGTVGGIDHDDDLDVNVTGGLDEDELDAVAARTMARIEVVRGLEFERTVPIEVVSREEFRSQRGGAMRGESDPAYSAWSNQIWKALFVVDEDTDVADEYGEIYGDAVVGYYTPADGGRIVLVSDSPEDPVVDRRTLVHELVHALQAQHFGLALRGDTHDERQAASGLVEGEAEYVAHRYAERCDEEWDCIEQVEHPAPDRPREFNMALFLVVYQPYSDGPAFVQHLHEEGNWSAVDRAHAERRPVSTEQIIHPDRYPDVAPREVSVEDRSTEEWERFTDLPGGQSPGETVGEAALYALFYAQGEISDEHLTGGDHDRSPFQYSHPITDGWAGDAVVPYRNDDGEFGYVFETTWRSEADATEFREAYERVLEERATDRNGSTYVVPEEADFSGAYRVRQDGDRVVVVHAPTVEELDEIHAVDEEPASVRSDVEASGSVRANVEPSAFVRSDVDRPRPVPPVATRGWPPSVAYPAG